MAFDETTAYHGDWQWVGRVFDVQWERDTDAGPIIVTGLKARFSSITGNLVSVAAGLGITTQAAAVVVWQPKPTDVDETDWEPTFAPKEGHVLRKSVPDPDVRGDGYVIVGDVAERAAKGRWRVFCQEEVVNVA